MGRAVLDSVAVYRVKVIDRATGAERWVNAEATSPEEAVDQVAAFGEMVGGAELVEVKRDATPSLSTPKQPAATPALKSAPTCSVCGGSMRRQVDRELWTGGVVLAIGAFFLLSFLPLVGFALGSLIGVAIESGSGAAPGSTPWVLVCGLVAGAVGVALWAWIILAIAHRRRPVLRCSRCSHSVSA